MIATPLVTRQERFAVVDSTNDVVRGWLDEGAPEVCLAVADEQSAGRGREGRAWTAPAGTGLLLSLGFRPTWLEPDRAWRLAVVVSLAMADAAETVAALEPGTIRLKWPNDLVIEVDGAVRKLAGVLGETVGLGTADPRVIVGIGVNVDWPAAEFPEGLADSMTSMREAADGRAVDRERLLSAFIARLEGGIEALRTGSFNAAAWQDRQLTNGRRVRLIAHDGGSEVVRAIGVDGTSGALIVSGEGNPGTERRVLTGEILHLRLDEEV
jgi:BirA family transcriptional regulator, biotin operon repressor / biotin---[acetyl-CoA-carboxylase] ligase